jgi:hypothetical protein
MKNLTLAIILLIFHYNASAQIDNSSVWINHSITTDPIKVMVTKQGDLNIKNRFGASLGIEFRKPLSQSFKLTYGIQFKSFRQSYIFGNKEMLIMDLNFHTPLLGTYCIKLKKSQALSFKLGFNGIFQANQKSSISTLDYSFEINRNAGYFPNVKFGFGFQSIKRRTFEVNLLSNLGFINNKKTIYHSKSTNSFEKTESNGSFVELEVQFKFNKTKIENE